MLRLSVLSCLLACLPLASHASAQVSLANTHCSGEMALTTASGLSLSCTGSLSLDGGSLASDSQISLFATGDLTLNNLRLYAPEISLSNLTGSLTIGSNVLFDTTHTAVLTGGATPINRWLPRPVIAWQSFEIGLNPGAVLSVSSSHSNAIHQTIIQRPALAGNLVLTPAQSQMLMHASGVNLVNSAGINVSAVPEPDSYMMILAGLGLMACRRKPTIKQR